MFPVDNFCSGLIAFLNQYCFAIVAITRKQSRETGIASAIL